MIDAQLLRDLLPYLGIAFVAVAGLSFLSARLPWLGGTIRLLLNSALIGVILFVGVRSMGHDPGLSAIARRIGLDRQEVTGGTTRVQQAGDGHFWVRATLNGVERRMLVDSGATVTALTAATAAEAGLTPDVAVPPVMMRTAGGLVRADPATLDRLRFGNVEADRIAVVIARDLPVDIIGMNVLSRLDSWRVEGRTLILVPAAADRRAAG